MHCNHIIDVHDLRTCELRNEFVDPQPQLRVTFTKDLLYPEYDSYRTGIRCSFWHLLKHCSYILGNSGKLKALHYTIAEIYVWSRWQISKAISASQCLPT